MSEPELKPCPKCQHDGEGVCYAVDDPFLPGGSLVGVECLACGFEGPRKDLIAEAQAEWNALPREAA